MIRALKLARLVGVRRFTTPTATAAVASAPVAPIAENTPPTTTTPDNIPPASIFDEAEDDDAWILPRTGKKKSSRVLATSKPRQKSTATSTSRAQKDLIQKSTNRAIQKAPITPNVAFNNRALGSGLIVIYHPEDGQIEFVLSQIRKYVRIHPSQSPQA